MSDEVQSNRARSDATADIDQNIANYLSKKRSRPIPIARGQPDPFAEVAHGYGQRAKRVMTKHNSSYSSKQYYDSSEIHTNDLKKNESERWWESND